jgi:hypothetical protein
MTGDGQVAGDHMPGSAGESTVAPARPGLPSGVILDICDGLLGQVGRRQHRFAWLRASGAGIEDCLPVAAITPATG